MQMARMNFKKSGKWEWAFVALLGVAMTGLIGALMHHNRIEAEAWAEVRPALQDALVQLKVSNAQLKSGGQVDQKNLDALEADATVVGKYHHDDWANAIRQAASDFKAGKQVD